MATPKTIADLESQEFVEVVPEEMTAEDFAKSWFEGAFNHTGPITSNVLFKEAGKTVQEHYFDSGSVDYLYTIK